MNRLTAMKNAQRMINAVIRTAIAKGSNAARVVVILLDVSDPTGAEIARGTMPELYAQALAARGPGDVAFLLNFIDRGDLIDMARAMLPRFSGYIDALPEPRPDEFVVLCFSDNDAEAFLRPIPANGTVGFA